CFALPRGRRQRSDCSASRAAQADLTLKPPDRAGLAAGWDAGLTVGFAAGLTTGAATASTATAALADLRSSARDGLLRTPAAAVSGLARERWQDLHDTSSATCVLTRV